MQISGSSVPQKKKQIKDRFTRIVVREKYLEPSFIYVSHICKSWNRKLNSTIQHNIKRVIGLLVGVMFCVNAYVSC